MYKRCKLILERDNSVTKRNDAGVEASFDHSFECQFPDSETLSATSKLGNKANFSNSVASSISTDDEIDLVEPRPRIAL
jgi:hypothetical protein